MVEEAQFCLLEVAIVNSYILYRETVFFEELSHFLLELVMLLLILLLMLLDEEIVVVDLWSLLSNIQLSCHVDTIPVLLVSLKV